MNILFRVTLFIACISAINLASSIGTPANADVVTDWNNAALDAIRADRTAPPIASRSLAILHASIYDAVNGIARTYEPYLVQSAVPRADDGWDAVVQPPGGSGPGVWVPTPPAFLPYLLPQWGFVVPFGMSSSSQFRPPGPPSLDSERYAADYEEVKELGAAVGSTRTEEQTEIALFWADGAGTETPPGHWNSIAQIIAAAQGNTLEENARLLALLNIAMADAAICAWDAKYTFDFWRPVTAIAFVEPELNWMSFIVTPPFPDYVSGHSTFSAAAATVLPLFYGTEDLPFTTGSDFLPGVYRSFATCFDAAEEAALSRIYGGIHFRSASEDGLQAGISIGQWTFTHYLRRTNRSRH